MKKFITLLMCSSTLLILNAQDIPNPGFETWIDNGTYEEPEFWSTPNPFTSLAGVVVVEKSEDAASGNYSARLETKDILGGTFQAPGLLTLGEFSVNLQTQVYSFSGGLPMTDLVSFVYGKYKYAGVDGDSANVIAYSFRHPQGEAIDTVAMGAVFLHDAADWTDFTLPVYQISPDTPDTFNIIILSSGVFNLTTGSVLFVDDISILTTGVNELKEDSQVTIYPNPTTDKVTFKASSAENNRKLFIYDLIGRVIANTSFTNPKITVDLERFPQGVYTYRIMNDAQLLKAGSFVKQ
jgi:Secretion system C-terminal sorting domain